MPDIFDELTSSKPSTAPPAGDIFDQLASASGGSLSSRGVSPIKSPRARVAAPGATSAGANPVPGATAPAPQPLPDWLAKKVATARANIAKYPQDEPQPQLPMFDPASGMPLMPLNEPAQAESQPKPKPPSQPPQKTRATSWHAEGYENYPETIEARRKAEADNKRVPFPNIPFNVEISAAPEEKESAWTTAAGLLKLPLNVIAPGLVALPNPSRKVQRMVHPYWLDYAFRSPKNPYTGPDDANPYIAGGGQRLIHPEELVSEAKHPEIHGALHAVGDIVTPGNIAIIAGTAPLGGIPGAAGKLLKAGTSAYFAFRMARNLYQENKVFHGLADEVNQLSQRLSTTKDLQQAAELKDAIDDRILRMRHLLGGAVVEGAMLGSTLYHAGTESFGAGREIAAQRRQGAEAQTIMGTLTRGETAKPLQPPADIDPAVKTMLDYETEHGNVKPPAPAPKPQLSLDPERVVQIGRQLASLSHSDRQGVLVKLHARLTQAIAEQKKFLGPDGQLHVVNSPAEAAKLAQKIINDSISEHDRRNLQSAEPTAPAQALKTSPVAAARNEITNPRSVPAMGHDMTADAPAVRRAQAKAEPVRGQEPTVKVKEQPPEVQAALAQPPAPVRAEEAARVGQRDPRSGRTILQPSNNLVQNERLANHAAPELETRLSRITASVRGAKFDRLRPQKGLQRLQEKVAEGKPPRTIGDNLAAQIVAPSVAAKDQIIAGLRREFPVINVDDKFVAPREKAGYPSANVQVRMPNGSTAEVQIVAPEVQAITDQTHRLYTQGRNFPEGSAGRTRFWDQAAAMHMQALEKFKARNLAEQQAAALAPGQRVVLKNGQTGKIVGFSNRFGRVTVRTSKGMRTVRVGDVRSRIALPKETLSSPDVNPKDLKKFTGRIESRLGAPEAQRGEIVLLNADALHEVHQAMKDHSFAGVTLPGDIADDVIAKIRVRAEKTGRSDLDRLADHLEQARSQYGVVPLALEGSNEAANISVDLEERIHGKQMDMGKGLLENYGDPDRDYAHPKTQLFFPWLRSRGEDPSDKVMAVLEISDLILRGDYREAGVSDEDALDWLTHHLETVRQIHGDGALEPLRRLARGPATAQLRRRTQ